MIERCRVGESMASDYYEHAAECPKCEAFESRSMTLSDIQRKLHIGTAQAMRVQAALYGGGSCRDRTCPKMKHLGSGYLHAEDDDAPYNVDGVRYCGRCHMAMD